MAVISDQAAARSSARAAHAYDTIRLELLEGQLAAGDKLSVVDLARRLDCSRVPVMEALKRLEREELVTIVPQVGCHVAAPSVDDVTDFFTLFAAVEGTVAALAAERRDADGVARFLAVCAEIDAALKTAGTPESNDPLYRRLNLKFHGAIHELARSPVASKMATGLWDRSDFYVRLAFGSLYFSGRVVRAHRAIRRAVSDGDPAAADRAVRDHLTQVGAGVTRQMSRH